MSTSSSVGVSDKLQTGKTVKTVLNGDFRRFLLSKPSFEELNKALLSTYGSSLPSSFSVKYQDDEDENCTITSDVELLEAFSVCDKLKRPVLKLVVIPDEEMGIDLPEAKEGKEAQKEAKKAPESSFSMETFIEKIRILAQDEKAQAALPVAVQAGLGALERANSVQDVIKAGVEASPYLRTHVIVKEMLGQLSSIPEDVNQKFLLLKSNPSTLGMIRMWLPSLVANIPLLVSMLPMILENLTAGGQFGGFGGPFGGPFGGFGGPGSFPPGPFPHPPFGGPGAFPHHPFGGSGGFPFHPPPTSPYARSAESSKPKGEEVHSGVRCDGCNREPIRGVRYKCSVCANYDLCQECETRNVHPEHPFLKIRASDSSDTESEASAPEGGFGRGWGRGWRRGFGHHFGHHGHHFGHHGGRGRWASLFGPQAQNWRCPRGERGEKVRVKFIENVTIPERAVVLPGQTLIKTWRVENVGKTDWPENSKLIFLRGDRSMSTEEEFPVPLCKAGQSVEISAVILTPTQQGRHTAVFRLADAERVPFGPRLWCDVVVPDLAGASDPSAATPVPSAPSSPWPGVAPMETAPEAKEGSISAPLTKPQDKPQAPNTDKPQPPKEPKEPGKYSIQMRALASMGFKDEELNLFLLESHNGNVQTVCEQLLQNLR